MPNKITFNDVVYSQESLSTMSTDELLALRNEVGEALGVAALKAFKSQEAAETQTWKALQRFEKSAEEPVEAPKAKAKKAKKEPVVRGLAKSAESKTVKRPSQKMFATISKTGEHDGSQGRQHRWPNYTDGMTIVDIIEKEGTEPWDVYSWVDAGIMTVTEATDAEFAERKAAWYEKHGLTDPEAAKAAKAAERAEAKTALEKAAAEKAAAKEKLAAEKAAAKEKADAEKAE